MPIQFPAVELKLDQATVPALAATIGVPAGAPISKPEWNPPPLPPNGSPLYPYSEVIV